MQTLSALKYALHILIHPFDGFWCAKTEKHGNLKAAGILVLLTILVSVLSSQLTGFIFKPNPTAKLNIFSEALSIIVPFLLWCISNWSITTLLDGKGTMKDILMVTAYSLTPIVIIQLPLILISNIIVMNESSIYATLNSLSYIWSGLLILIGIMTVHEYSIGKTLLTIIIAIVGMAATVFLILLFIALIQQVVNFGYIFFKELSLRS